MPRGSPYNATMMMASDAGGGGKGRCGCCSRGGGHVVPPAPPLPPVQFWLPGFLSYKASVAVHSSGDDPSLMTGGLGDQAPYASSASLSSSAASSHLPPPPVSLALGARRACVSYTPVFQGIDLRVVRPLAAREKLAMRDAVDVLDRLGASGCRGG